MAEETEEDHNLRIAVMKADLALKTAQTFWERPRSFSIIVSAIGTIVLALVGAASFVSYRIGQRELPAAPVVINNNFPPGTIITIPPINKEVPK